jgi:hypothetical protein
MLSWIWLLVALFDLNNLLDVTYRVTALQRRV